MKSFKEYLKEKIDWQHPAYKQGYQHALKDGDHGWASQHTDDAAKHYKAGFEEGLKAHKFKNKTTKPHLD